MKKLFLFAFAAVGLMACDGSSRYLQLSPSSVNMHYEETKQVTVLSETGPFEWSTADDFNAKVDANGKITAGHVGSTVITAKKGNQTGTCSVVVTPQYYLYETPYFGWGESMTQVQNKLGTPYQTQDQALVYLLSEANGIIAMYMFTNNKLTGIGITLNVNNYSTLTHYLLERYQLFSVEDSKYYFMDASVFDKATLGVMLAYVSTSSMHYYQVIYMPTNQTQNVPSRVAPFQENNNLIVPEDYLYLFK